MISVQKDQGFTLIEVVIALGILAIGIMAMFAMQTIGIKGNATSNEITKEASWGSDYLERINTVKYSDYQTESTKIADTLSKKINPTSGPKIWDVTAQPPTYGPLNEDIMTITIVIKNRINNKKVTLQYLKANEGV